MKTLLILNWCVLSFLCGYLMGQHDMIATRDDLCQNRTFLARKIGSEVYKQLEQKRIKNGVIICAESDSMSD